MVDFDVIMEINWLAKQKDSVNCWGTKVMFDLDKKNRVRETRLHLY